MIGQPSALSVQVLSSPSSVNSARTTPAGNGHWGGRHCRVLPDGPRRQDWFATLICRDIALLCYAETVVPGTSQHVWSLSPARAGTDVTAGTVDGPSMIICAHR